MQPDFLYCRILKSLETAPNVPPDARCRFDPNEARLDSTAMMARAPEHYDSTISFMLAQAKYALLRRALRRMAAWTPLDHPKPGYTIVVGVPWAMWELVDIPLLSL